MGTRQYIGARYVPIIYAGTNGSNWDSGVEYEALTIVTYLNASYTSIKTVPSGAGNPKDNPEYWSLTGNYNAQITEYLEAVEKYSAEVEALKSEVEADISEINTELASHASLINLIGKNVLIIGDSISVDGNSWVDSFRENMSLLNTTVDNISVSGITLADHDTTSGMATILKNREVKKYDIIILFCGTNDALINVPLGTRGSHIQTEFCGALNSLTDTLNTMYSDAVVYCCLPMKRYFDDSVNRRLLLNCYRALLWYWSTLKNWCVIDTLNAPRFDLSSSSIRAKYSDGTHPNKTYQPILANFITEAILNGGNAVADNYYNSYNLVVKNDDLDGTVNWRVSSKGEIDLRYAFTMKTEGLKTVTLPVNLIPDWSALWCANITDNTYVPNGFVSSTGVLSLLVQSGKTGNICTGEVHTRLPQITATLSNNI